MYQFSYADIQTESVADARDSPRQLLSRSIDILSKASEAKANSNEAIAALNFTNRVWTSLMDDLGDPKNTPPRGCTPISFPSACGYGKNLRISARAAPRQF